MTAGTIGALSGDGRRREESLQPASQLFASSGLRTSLHEIADACGIQPGSLYHHFDSKEAIVVELVRRYHAEHVLVVPLPPDLQFVLTHDGARVAVVDIAAAAGLDLRAVYRVVASKDEVLASVLGDYAAAVGDGWARVAEADASPLEKLDALLWLNVNVLDRCHEEHRIQTQLLKPVPPTSANLPLTFGENPGTAQGDPGRRRPGGARRRRGRRRAGEAAPPPLAGRAWGARDERHTVTGCGPSFVRASRSLPRVIG